MSMDPVLSASADPQGIAPKNVAPTFSNLESKCYSIGDDFSYSPSMDLIKASPSVDSPPASPTERVECPHASKMTERLSISVSEPLPLLAQASEQLHSPASDVGMTRTVSTELPPKSLSRTGSFSCLQKPPLPPGAQQKALRARRLSSSRSMSTTPRAREQQQKFGKMDDPRSLATPEKLQAMTLIELKFMCRTNNWFGFSNLNKQDLIAFILEKVKSDDAPVSEPVRPVVTSPRKLPSRPDLSKYRQKNSAVNNTNNSSTPTTSNKPSTTPTEQPTSSGSSSGTISDGNTTGSSSECNARPDLSRLSSTSSSSSSSSSTASSSRRSSGNWPDLSRFSRVHATHSEPLPSLQRASSVTMGEITAPQRNQGIHITRTSTTISSHLHSAVAAATEELASLSLSSPKASPHASPRAPSFSTFLNHTPPSPKSLTSPFSLTMPDGRRKAEFVAATEIAKGFKKPTFGSDPAVLVLEKGVMVDAPSRLAAKMLQQHGMFLWQVRAPGSSQWLPAYLGIAGPSSGLPQAQTVAQAHLALYLQDDGCFGPADKRDVYLGLLDLQRRGFDLEVRFRPVKNGSAGADLVEKLARYSFALVSEQPGGARPLELPGGQCVEAHPIVNRDANFVYIEVSRRRAAR